ncbi:MAG: hypothetical protein M1119_09980 [Firmicutes bacterium]|nr:hypothetical protein [Bacillota bacterium]
MLHIMGQLGHALAGGGAVAATSVVLLVISSTMAPQYRFSIPRNNSFNI